MTRQTSIITVGISPAWDITCQVDSPQWGEHKKISSETNIPAGKALNVSRALAWLKTKSTAAGLWGQKDYQQMLEELTVLKKYIEVCMTTIPQRTRQNITIIDTHATKEMHLRAESKLASPQAIKKLSLDLKHLVKPGDISLFAGALPKEPLLDDIITIIENINAYGAKVAIDTSGPALKKIVETGKIWLIKPNLSELSELTGRQLKNETPAIIQAARKLLNKVDIILISRAEKGAIAVTKEYAFHAKCTSPIAKVINTVGCGDYFLAGFLKAFSENPDIPSALQTAIQTATAKAYGLTGNADSLEVRNKIVVDISSIQC